MSENNGKEYGMTADEKLIAYFEYLNAFCLKISGCPLREFHTTEARVKAVFSIG